MNREKEEYKSYVTSWKQLVSQIKFINNYM